MAETGLFWLGERERVAPDPVRSRGDAKVLLVLQENDHSENRGKTANV